jgi:hypothetical protein
MALTGSPPLANYLDLLQLENSGSGLPVATPQTVYDGAGNASLLELSQQSIAFTGILSCSVATGLIMDTGVSLTGDELISDKITYKTNTDVGIFFGSGDPESAVVASPGSVFLRDDGTLGSSFYIKEAGTGNTGWTPVELVDSFLDLSDTPGSYMASRWVKVNAGGNALEFISFDPIEKPSGAAQGEILYFDGSAWDNLGVGTSGQVLITQGAGANPAWSTPGWITLPASPAQGQVLYHNGTAWAALSPGTSGQVLTTNGAAANPSWEDAVTGGANVFTDLTDVPATYSGGTEFVMVNSAGDGLEFVDPATALAGYIPDPGAAAEGDLLYWDGAAWANLALGANGEVLKSTGSALDWGTVPSGGSKEYVTTEYDTGDTWRGKPIYAVIVDFGAGPNNTTKSVDSGLAVNDVFHVVDMQVMANDPQYGWLAREDSENKASFTYNKLDYKVYCTTSNDLSGVEYQVLLKYIKEPAVMSGTDPHIIATISGGTWAGLAPGVHLLTPDNWAYTYAPTGTVLSLSSLQCTWEWTASASAKNYKISLHAQLNSALRNSTGRLSSVDGTVTVADSRSYTGAAVAPYTGAIAIGDRLFDTYTVGGVTITLGRASTFITNPPQTP